VSEERQGEERRGFARDLERQAEYAKALLEEIDRQRQEAERQDLNFTAPTEEQLKKKVAKAESPMIVFQGWSGSVAAPGTINYTVGISNPDPIQWIWLFAHVFVGPANIARDVGHAVSAVDPRFPRLTMPKFDGLSLAPGTTQSLNFSLTVDGDIERSNYLGNTFLFHSTWHDVGQYLDRSLFVFEVT
jgi:hypothetical protein